MIMKRMKRNSVHFLLDFFIIFFSLSVFTWSNWNGTIGLLFYFDLNQFIWFHLITSSPCQPVFFIFLSLLFIQHHSLPCIYYTLETFFFTLLPLTKIFLWIFFGCFLELCWNGERKKPIDILNITRTNCIIIIIIIIIVLYAYVCNIDCSFFFIVSMCQWVLLFFFFSHSNLQSDIVEMKFFSFQRK